MPKFTTLPFAIFMNMCKKLQKKEVLYSEFGGFHYFIVDIKEGGYRLTEYKKKQPHERRGQKVSMSWFGTRNDLQIAIQLNPEWYGINPITRKITNPENWLPFLESFTHRELRTYDSVTRNGLPSYSYVPVESEDKNSKDNA